MIGVNSLGAEGPQVLAPIIQRCSILTMLHLGYIDYNVNFAGMNNIGSEGAKALASALPQCRSLTHLYIGTII